jgi:hypothetical protein
MKSTLSLRKSLLALALCLPVAAAQAQAADDAEREISSGAGEDVRYNGVWNVRFDGGGSAVLIFTPQGESWVEKGRAAMPKVCQGKRLPMTIQGGTDEGVQFTVFGSPIDKSCPDITYIFRVVTDAKVQTLRARLPHGGGMATMTLAPGKPGRKR